MSNKLKILILIIIFIALGFGFYHYKHKKPITTVSTPAIVPIILDKSDIISPKQGEVDDSILFTGDLASRDQSIISSEVGAKVLKVLVNEGDKVKRNQVLAYLDDTELEQTVLQQKALLTSVKVNLVLSRKKLMQQKDLFQQGFISKIAYDELQSNYQDAQAKVEQQEAALKNARKKLSDSVIRAPYEGVIYLKDIDAGQFVAVNNKLFGIASLKVLQIQAAISSSQINLIKSKQLVHFVVENSDTIYSGEISRINPVAQAGTRSYMVYIDFDNKDAQLKSGQFVKGEITIKSLPNVISVPRDVIRYSSTNSKPYVLAIDANNKVIKKSLDIILTDSVHDMNAVTGVEPSDKLIINTINNVSVGSSVTTGS